MSTIMSQISHGGQVHRRCDSNCHNAKHPTCRCICRGRYATGSSQASRELLTEDWANRAEAQGEDVLTAFLRDAVANSRGQRVLQIVLPLGGTP